MEKVRPLIGKMKETRGATAIIVALMISAFLGFGALAVDIGYVMVTKNELQNVSDSAALAATRQLGSIYEPMSAKEQSVYVCDPAPLIAIAKDIALKNKAAGINIVVNDEDVIIGQWDTKTKTLTPTYNQPDAVSVIARRDDLANNPITTFFARIFGINTIALSADATAALTGLSKIGPGGLPVPMGISKKWFEKPEFCKQPIKFYPTGTLEGCAGWHTYDSKTHSASQLAKILKGLKDGTYLSPETTVGMTEFNFTGGTVGSAYDDMKALFDYMKTRDDDGNPDTWTTTVVVYDLADCSNPTNEIGIVGFATAIIKEVLGPSTKIINAEVLCDDVERGRGSGGNYGTKGSIPGLVE